MVEGEMKLLKWEKDKGQENVIVEYLQLFYIFFFSFF